MGGQVRAIKDGRVGWIVFDHPERHNAISVEMWRQIPDTVRTHAEDPEIRLVVMRGAGEAAFVSGADISEFGTLRTADKTHDYDADSGRAFGALANLDKPLLAMIHGYCVGGGVALALAADLRYAADDAVFAVPAARLGVGYPAAGLEALARLVGSSRTKEIFFTARRFDAARAEQMGLLNAVYPRATLARSVAEIANQIAQNAPLTLLSVKLSLREMAHDPASRDLDKIEQAMRACFESQDYREGVRAWLEKRPPEFQGR